MLVQYFVSLLWLAVAAGAAARANRAAEAPPGFCGSVKQQLVQSDQNAAASSYCASAVSASAKTVTVTKTKTEATTLVSTKTKHSISTPSSTYREHETYTVFSGSTSTTITITTTSIVANSSFTCMTSGSGSAAPVQTAAAERAFPASWSDEKVSSACNCLVNGPATKTVTETVTKHITKHRTSITTSVETRDTAIKYTTVVKTVTSPSVSTSTSYIIRTATAGPNQSFHVSVDYPSAVPSFQPLAVYPEYFDQFITYVAGQGSGAEWTLNDDCSMYNSALNVTGGQGPTEPNPGPIYDVRPGNFYSGGPVTCVIDLETNQATFTNPYGGSNVYVYLQEQAGFENYAIVLGEECGDCGALVTLYAIFE